MELKEKEKLFSEQLLNRHSTARFGSTSVRAAVQHCFVKRVINTGLRIKISTKDQLESTNVELGK